MRYFLLLALVLGLGGCTSAIEYSTWDPTKATPVESTSLKFSLQDSTVTLANATQAKASAPGNQGGNQTPKPPAPSCTENDWWTCFNQVSALAAMAPPTQPSAPSRHDDLLSLIYVAAPDDSSNLWLTTTSISGTAVAEQDTLYSSVTVKYTSNASTIIAAAGSGAITGFGIGGPALAAAGLVIGAVVATVPGPKPLPGQAVVRQTLAMYICSNEPVDITKANTLAPTLSLPLTISAADARPLAQPRELTHVDLPSGNDGACWHTLPNTNGLASISTTTLNGSQPGNHPRPPITGDGWLYRMVAITDPTAAPKGAIPTKTYFSYAGPRQDFPYSACRTVELQITWWKELATAIEAAASGHLPTPRVVTFSTVVADPDYVDLALVRNGGVINFKPDCGANVTANTNTSTGAIINAIVTNVQNIYKAEQSYDASKKK